MHYTPRVAEPTLSKFLKTFPIVGISGPRQSGKSTLASHHLPNYRYVTFDDPLMVRYFEEDPKGFMQKYDNQVIFDEVQFVPEIFHYLKMAVDNDRKNYGKYVITGTSQFTLIQKITESLAGRIGLIKLLPFQFKEFPTHIQSEAIYRGAYPELVLRNYRDSESWYATYLETYLTKDVRAVSDIGNLRDFRRLLYLLASNTSQVLRMTDYATNIGVSLPTIKRWISVLEASYVIFLLPPFFENFGKRIVKRPKLYFYDTGLVSYLTGVTSEEVYVRGPMAGPLFENYIVSEILKKELHSNSHAELYYLRTTGQIEIDLIVDRKQTRELIEIKKSATFNRRYINPIESIIRDVDKGYLLYNGEKFPYHGNIEVINYRDYLKD